MALRIMDPHPPKHPSLWPIVYFSALLSGAIVIVGVWL